MDNRRTEHHPGRVGAFVDEDAAEALPFAIGHDRYCVIFRSMMTPFSVIGSSTLKSGGISNN
jgi:hypothetical protein